MRKVYLVITFLLFALILVGCGNSEKQADTNDSSKEGNEAGKQELIEIKYAPLTGGPGDVVLRQAPVEVRGLAQRGQRIGRTVGESSAPQAQSFAHRSSFPTSTDAPVRSLK